VSGSTGTVVSTSGSTSGVVSTSGSTIVTTTSGSNTGKVITQTTTTTTTTTAGTTTSGVSTTVLSQPHTANEGSKLFTKNLPYVIAGCAFIIISVGVVLVATKCRKQDSNLDYYNIDLDVTNV